MSASIRFRHRRDCVGERMDEPRIGSKGDTLVRCISCQMLTVLIATDLPTESPSEPVQPAPAISSTHRCRAHLDQAVTWRGTGCPVCAAEREQRRPRADVAGLRSGWDL